MFYMLEGRSHLTSSALVHSQDLVIIVKGLAITTAVYVLNSLRSLTTVIIR